MVALTQPKMFYSKTFAELQIVGKEYVDADKDSVYYWRVKSSDGENSAFSQIYAFRTGA